MPRGSSSKSSMVSSSSRTDPSFPTYIHRTRVGSRTTSWNVGTPSFVVTRDRQTYKCFGCGEGGSAVGFLLASADVEKKGGRGTDPEFRLLIESPRSGFASVLIIEGDSIKVLPSSGAPDYEVAARESVRSDVLPIRFSTGSVARFARTRPACASQSAPSEKAGC